VEHSRLIATGGELHFTTPPQFMLAMQAGELDKAVRHLNAGNWRIRVFAGDVGTADPKPQAQPPATTDEATGRALANPEVQRFREVFPGAEVRVVRNLRD
jgi:hypothetical protein